MISDEKCNLNEKYKHYILLFLVIIILIVITRYSISKKNYSIYLNDVKQDIKYDVYSKNDEKYVQLNDLITIFNENIYYDKISQKLIMTTFNNLFRIDINDEKYFTKNSDSIYVNLNKVAVSLDYDIYIQNNDIHILTSNYVQGVIYNNRTEIFDKNGNKVLVFANKQDKIKVLVSDILKYENQKIISVVVTQNNNTFYGYALKDNVKYEYVKENIEYKQKQLFLKAEDKLNDTNDIKNVSAVILSLIRLSDVNSISEINNSKDVTYNTKTYAGFNISQKASNFDPDIFSNMVSSEENKKEVISKTLDYIVKNKLAGVCVDFSNFKISDKDLFIEFVKELSATIHKNEKKIIVNLPSMEYISLVKFVDYVVINAYSERNVSSRISGPISSIGYVENIIKQALKNNKYNDRIIIEIPMYSVLWTERKGTVINAEIYSMSLQKEYLKTNNLKVIKDVNSDQNYINFTKGITTFKMWIEDEQSILRKVNLVKEYNLAGVSLYKSGMEYENIFEKVVNTFN